MRLPTQVLKERHHVQENRRADQPDIRSSLHGPHGRRLCHARLHRNNWPVSGSDRCQRDLFPNRPGPSGSVRPAKRSARHAQVAAYEPTLAALAAAAHNPLQPQGTSKTTTETRTGKHKKRTNLSQIIALLRRQSFKHVEARGSAPRRMGTNPMMKPAILVLTALSLTACVGTGVQPTTDVVSVGKTETTSVCPQFTGISAEYAYAPEGLAFRCGPQTEIPATYE